MIKFIGRMATRPIFAIMYSEMHMDHDLFNSVLQNIKII